MKTIFLFFTFSLGLLISCNSKISNSENLKIAEDVNFNKKCLLLSYKYGIPERIVDTIVLSYLQTYDPWEWAYVVNGGFSKEEKEYFKSTGRLPGEQKSLEKIVAKISARDSLNNAVISSIIIDYANLELMERTQMMYYHYLETEK